MADEYSFPRYLAAKRSVDDRALNMQVWHALHSVAANYIAPRVLEIGCGTGTMLRRLVERGVLRSGSYHGIDALAENTISAVEQTRIWAENAGFPVTGQKGELLLALPGGALDITFTCGDLFERLPVWKLEPGFDLLVASAFLDLVDMRFTLPELRSLLLPGGVALFTINFDGMTAFEPVFDAVLETQILDLYHRSMDERVVNGVLSGGSRAGRHLFHLLPQCGYEILAAGSSDWVVYPKSGRYPDDEAYFLRFILRFFEETLRGHPELDAVRFEDWMALRLAQIERGELVFLAHQIDFLARRPA